LAKIVGFLPFFNSNLLNFSRLRRTLAEMEKNELKLSIVVLSWNTRELLGQCLESVRQSLEKHYRIEIIVVDNGSTDGSVGMVKELIKKYTGTDRFILRLVENEVNLGYAKGNNVGISKAEGKYLMLLNSDTLVGKGQIEKLINFLDSHLKVDIVGPRLLNSDRTFQASCGHFPNVWVTFLMLFKEHFGGSDYVRSSPRRSGFTDWLVGAAFVARREVFEKIGGFDEKIFMYMEEVEWFYRARKAGFKAFFYKDAQITHLGRGSSKTGKKDPILNIYRGLIYFCKKHKSLPELLAVGLMLKLKALGALLIGTLTGNRYLKETYGEAFKIS
jgi:GT2 family glycosyltransferase